MDQKRVPLLKDMGYSDKGIRLIMNQINMGTMQDSSVTAKEEGTCGDVLILHLKISDDIIMDAAYEYIGCAGLQATASALTEMIKGKSIDSISSITVEDIINYLEGLPKQKLDCAVLASSTLQKALELYKKKEPV